MAKKGKDFVSRMDKGITGGPKGRKHATKAVKEMNRGANELRKLLRLK